MQEEQLMQMVQDEFAGILLRARQMLIRRAKMIHPDLQDPGYRILAVVIKEAPQQQGALAERLRLDKATISRLINHLESLKLVTRSPDPRDGRAQLVSATPAAREKWFASGSVLSQELRHHLGDWDTDELKSFRDQLHRLNHSMDEIL
ncbi:MarR family winged helix-turn-helix transcriptional regulator [Glutamicibacter sp. NPDC087344]|uniref:MarR family winged helix-turn-helix transcriptional regulator n=1 Tax=Glutamicibacter sp. NPDC087344 TaxID=3363994 RepID=UPI0038040765